MEVPDSSIRHLKTADLMQMAASQISWEPKSGYTTTLPDGVGERTGGFRRLMQPRLTFGHDKDELDFHRGLGFVWIVILLPLGAVLFLIWRWVTKTMQPPVRTSAATNNAVTSDASRCPACGSPVTVATPRCVACGTSLIRRSG